MDNRLKRYVVEGMIKVIGTGKHRRAYRSISKHREGKFVTLYFAPLPPIKLKNFWGYKLFCPPLKLTSIFHFYLILFVILIAKIGGALTVKVTFFPLFLSFFFPSFPFFILYRR